MKKFFRSVININDKELNWFNCNFCYITTILMICIMLICHFALSKQIDSIVQKNNIWDWNIIFQSFRYDGDFHLLGNIMGLLTISIFLERHFGSLKYILLLFISIPISNLFCFAFFNNWNGEGFSCVEYFWYANIVWLLVINYKTYFVGKFRWIFPILLVAIIIIMMSWAWSGDGMNGVGLKLFNGFNNNGHAGPFLGGALVGLLIHAWCFLPIKNAK